MPKPATTQTLRQPQTTDQPEDGITAALAMLADTEGSVRVYRKRQGIANAWVVTYPASEFDIEAVGRDFGGGDYFAQVCGADRMKTIQGGGSFSIDGPPKARRVQPAAPSPFTFPVAEPVAAAPVDPLSAALTAIVQRLDRIEQGRTLGAGDDRPGWRDIMQAMQAQQPAAQATSGVADMMKLLPTFLEMVKPKSSIEEMFGALKLMKYASRSGIADAAVSDESPASGFDLAAILNSPVGAALAAKLMGEKSEPASPPPRVRETVDPAPALPAPKPAPAPATTPAAALPAELADQVRKFAPMLLLLIEGSPAITGTEIADLVMNSSEPDALHAMLSPLPDGALAVAFVQAEPKLQPYAMRLITAEGVLREAARPVPTEEDAEPEPTPLPTPAPLPVPAPLPTPEPEKPAPKRKAKA